jgi:hypothetical protein
VARAELHEEEVALVGGAFVVPEVDFVRFLLAVLSLAVFASLLSAAFSLARCEPETCNRK